MIEQQAFESLSLGAASLGAVRDHNGPVLGWRLTGGHDFRLHGNGSVRLAFTDLDQAHAATGDDGQRWMPAVVRNEYAAFERRLDQVQLLVADIDRLVIDVNDRHQTVLS